MAVDDDLIRAYRETLYEVDAPVPFVLRIGEHSGMLLSLYRASGLDTALFITACNPFSKLLPEIDNARRQALLTADLERFGVPWYFGTGHDPQGLWPGERSCLVLGLAEGSARNLGIRHQQNAVVWCGPDAVPELMLLHG